MKKTSVIAFILIMGFGLTAHASSLFMKGETFYAAHKYMLKRDDSEDVAKRVCHIEASRKLLQKVKVYIRSESEKNHQEFSDDEYIIFAPAILEIKTVKENIEFIEDKVAAVVTIKTKIGAEEFISVLVKTKKNRQLTARIEGQQREIRKLENEILDIEDRLQADDGPDVILLRRERKIKFKELDELLKKKISRASARDSAEKLLRNSMTLD